MRISGPRVAALILSTALLAAFGSPEPGTRTDGQGSLWRPAAAFGGPPTWFSSAFTIGDRAYVGTGYGAKNELWEYDPARDAWTRKADMPGPKRGAAVAFAVGNRGYIGLGYGDDNRFADLWEYDPAADRWTEKAPLPGAVRDHSGAFVIGGKAYVFGGMTCQGQDCRNLKEVWEYDPARDAWTRKADCPWDILTAAVFVLNGKGYVGTGSDETGYCRTLREYDPRTDRWTKKADFPGPARFRAVGWALDGKGYIGTGLVRQGRGEPTVFDDVWAYEPAADAWTPAPSFGGPARGAAVGFVLGRRVYIGTGTNAKRDLLTDFWVAGPDPTK